MTSNAAWDKLRLSFAGLANCHARLQSACETLDNATLAQFFGAELDCPCLREKIRRHGDGYTMHLRVADAEALCDFNAVVLFAMSSPKLDRNSVFDGTPLPEIPYWRENRCLRPVVKVANQTYCLLYLSWQQNVPVHGGDDSHAKENFKLLSKNAGIRSLLEQEPVHARAYIEALGAWCNAAGRPFLLFHQRQQLDNLDDALLPLVRRQTAKCIRTSLRGKNYQIMKRYIPHALACLANTKG